MPEPLRNELSIATLRLGDGRLAEARIARTGYTGEPVAFELFVAAHDGPALWDALVGAGAAPVGLGARDTLRLEAGLPLYGHELGTDPDGREIPIFSCPLATFAVSFSPRKGDFVGRAALERQQRAYKRILQRDWSLLEDLPRLTRPVAVTGRGIAREGAPVHAAEGDSRFGGETFLGWVTSGTAVPYWGLAGEGLCSSQTEEHELRSIALAYLDSRVLEDDEVEVDVRGRRVPGLVVPHHLRSDAPPCARAIIWDYTPQLTELEGGEAGEKALRLLNKAIANHEWRQEECIDLIPSEMTASPADPAAEHHRPVGALRGAQEGRGLLRRRRLLLPGHRLHPRGGAAAGQRVPRVPRLSRGRDPHRERPDGQHRRVQRAGRLPQQGRPQGRAAPHRQGGQQPHRQGRPPERAADGRAARLRGARPAHGTPGGRRHPRAARQPVQGGRGGAPRRDRAGAPRAHHPRQEHGAAPGAGLRGPAVPRRGRHPGRAHVRHGPRARPGRAPLPGAVRRGRRHRHRLDAQDVLRHAARHRRRRAGRRPTRSTTSGRRSSGARSPAR